MEKQKKISHHFSRHFSGVARRYVSLRKTDPEPILFIKKKLQKLRHIRAADVGCGAGRYDLLLFQHLGKPLRLLCIDSNKQMLEHLRKYLVKNKVKNFQTKKASVESLPIKSNSLDCIFTFNAIHHFSLIKFLREAKRILKNNGYLFIYTRLRSQDKKNIWGKYFPLFNKKELPERRLYELDEFKKATKKIPKLMVQSTHLFKYKRIFDIDKLTEQAKGHHYSTFSLYSKKEFKESLAGFKKNLQRHFRDLKNISWSIENVLLVIRKK